MDDNAILNNKNIFRNFFIEFINYFQFRSRLSRLAPSLYALEVNLLQSVIQDNIELRTFNPAVFNLQFLTIIIIFVLLWFGTDDFENIA